MLCCVQRGEGVDDGGVRAEEIGDFVAGEVAAETYVEVREACCGWDGEERVNGDGGVRDVEIFEVGKLRKDVCE